MGLNNHALWQVATKALIFKDGKLLALTTPDGYLDFPGGRVDETERKLPWTEALNREIDEELGEAIRVEIGKTVFVSKRQYERDGAVHHIAAIYFEARYVSGEVTLSDEHGSFAWINPQELVTDKYKLMSDDERTQLRAWVSDLR